MADTMAAECTASLGNSDGWRLDQMGHSRFQRCQPVQVVQSQSQHDLASFGGSSATTTMSEDLKRDSIDSDEAQLVRVRPLRQAGQGGQPLAG
jgi:hypothetical protein